MAEDNQRPRIEVHGGYYDIHDNTFLGGTNIFGEPNGRKVEEEPPMDFSEECVKHAIELLMLGNTKRNKRWWFIPYRVLKDEGKTTDLKAFSVYINKLFDNNLPLPIDIHDLSKEIEVMCFAKPVKEWNAFDAPVGGSTYKTYKALIRTFKGFLQGK